MAQKRRPIELKFHVTEGEREIIARKMELAGTRCTAAYLRKMALDGYTLKMELPEHQELVSLLRRSSGNLNQIAKRVNSTGRIYDTDMGELLQSQERLWAAANDLLTRLTPLKVFPTGSTTAKTRTRQTAASLSPPTPATHTRLRRSLPLPGANMSALPGDKSRAT